MSKRMDGPVQVLRPQAIPIPRPEVYRNFGRETVQDSRRDGPWGTAGTRGSGIGQLCAGSHGSRNPYFPDLASSSLPKAASTAAQRPPSVSSSLSRSLRNAVRRIFVQTETGEVAVVEVDCEAGAGKVKRSVQAALSVPTEQADLFFGGHVLEDLHRLHNDVPVLLKRGLTRSASCPGLALPARSSGPAALPAGPAPQGRSLSALPAAPVPEGAAPLGARPSAPSQTPFFEMVGGLAPPQPLVDLIQEAVVGVVGGAAPEAATGGMGGAYYFHNALGQKVVIVKPTDEEPFAPNNPNGYVGRSLGQPGLKKAIRVGEAGLREVAAYLLDHGAFAGVPYTTLVRASHPVFHVNCGLGAGLSSQTSPGKGRRGPPGSPWLEVRRGRETGPGSAKRVRPGASKLCSLQQYVQHDYDSSECGTSRFPVSAVHRIGILDVRVFNTDRHSGNILVRRQGKDRFNRHHTNPGFWLDEAVELIPIDHGFCLPETLEAAYFEWLHWPQASLPFSDDELDYIASLDVHAEVEMLREQLPMIREGCLRVLMLSTTLLQKGATAGLTLADIGSIMSRDVRGAEEVASDLEVLCLEALRIVESFPPLNVRLGLSPLSPSFQSLGACNIEEEEGVVGSLSPTGSPSIGRGWDTLKFGSSWVPSVSARDCSSPPPREVALRVAAGFGPGSPGLLFRFDESPVEECSEAEATWGHPVVRPLESRSLSSKHLQLAGSLCSPSAQHQVSSSAPLGGTAGLHLPSSNCSVPGTDCLLGNAFSNGSPGGCGTEYGEDKGHTSKGGWQVGTPRTCGKLRCCHESFKLRLLEKQLPCHQQQQLAHPSARLSGLRLGSAGLAGSRVRTLMCGQENERDVDGILPGGASFLLSDMGDSKWEQFYEVYADLVEDLVLRKSKERSVRNDLLGTSCQW